MLRARDERALSGQKMSYVRDSLTGAAFTQLAVLGLRDTYVFVSSAL